MARRRVDTTSTPMGAPPELADPEHKVWTSRATAEALAKRYGLDVRWSVAPSSAVRHPEFLRFKAVRRSWAAAAGMLTVWGVIDRHRLAEAGVFAGERGPRIRNNHGTVDLAARRLLEAGT